MPIQSVNPANNTLIQTFEPHTDTYVTAALERSEKTYRQWKEVSFEERSKLMLKAAEALRERKSAYAQLLTLEMGKVMSEAQAEIEKCAKVCEYYAARAAGFLADEPLESENGRAFISYEPLGAVLAVMPWNFPFWQVFRFAAPTLMAGNTALLKHASNVPQAALAIEEVFMEAGFPNGAFQTLLIGADQVKQVIEDDRVKAVTLTGSESAGSQVAAIAAGKIKKSVLELGGSDPFIVLDDADPDKTARIAAKARMINCGQSCIAAKRFIVMERIAETFLEKLSAYMSAYEPGDPAEPLVKCGPMASEQLAEELLRQVEGSIKMGAVPLIGGKRPDREGAYFEPTILTAVRPGMPAYEEELFGPVASVMVVKDETEAIEVANDSKFGLGGSVWTNDPQRGLSVARKVETGAMFVNAMVASDPALPFGGIKTSGYGRELSHLGIREFVNAKTIVIA